MKHWANLKRLITAAAITSLCTGCVIPPGLSKLGKVCEAQENLDGQHRHESTLESWHIAEGRRLRMDNDLPRWFRKFVDVPNYPRSDLQDVDMHVVNYGSDPLPSNLGGCKYRGNKADGRMYLADDRLGKYLFAFGIAEIGSVMPPMPKTPHMIVYLPLRTKVSTPADAADEFRMLLLHMESDANQCPSDPVLNKRCEALAYLRGIWTPGADGESRFKEAVAQRIDAIIGPELRAKYHNGVIHGNF